MALGSGADASLRRSVVRASGVLRPAKPAQQTWHALSLSASLGSGF